jgi:hypothetical protein
MVGISTPRNERNKFKLRARYKSDQIKNTTSRSTIMFIKKRSLIYFTSNKLRTRKTGLGSNSPI